VLFAGSAIRVRHGTLQIDFRVLACELHHRQCHPVPEERRKRQPQQDQEKEHPTGPFLPSLRARSGDIRSKYSTREAFLVAEVYAFRNQRDEAFVWLDRAYAQHEDDLPMTNLLPELKNLHSDPRYAAFLKKLNLPA
jgi:hypothetical protein